MAFQFRAVADEFCTEIQVIHALVSSFDRTEEQSRLKAVVSNAAILLLAATFEGFVRDMAGLAARAAVARSGQVADVPNRMLRTAWQRTFNSIARFEVPQNTRTEAIHQLVGRAEKRSATIFAFLRGKTSLDIYADLVQNDVNMRTREINRLFKLSEVSDVCREVSREQSVIDHFQVDSEDVAGSELANFIDRFIEQRNHIAHADTSVSSMGAGEVYNHVEAFRVFAVSLCAVLERTFSKDGWTGESGETTQS